jgi:lipopolysaccharide export system permease protein
MIFSTIWERYFFKELLKVFFLFLGCFFFLYAMMDYSARMQHFIIDKRVAPSVLAIYYANYFIKYAGLLVPLALMIATIKVLYTLNLRRELVALQASGMRLRTLLRPFFFLAALCTLFNYLNAEFLAPNSISYLENFRKKHFHKKMEKSRKGIHVLYLKDQSKLVYQTLDKQKNAFFDLFWIRSPNDIWRIKYLSSDPNHPEGQWVDHLERDKDGYLQKTASFETYLFKELKWDRTMTQKGLVPMENRKISQLFHTSFSKKTISSYEKAQALSYFLFKCAIPLLSFLVVLSTAPYCVRYSRNSRPFVTYTLSLFCFVALYALLDAAVILGENLIFSPWLTISAPLLLCTFFFTRKWATNL